MATLIRSEETKRKLQDQINASTHEICLLQEHRALLVDQKNRGAQALVDTKKVLETTNLELMKLRASKAGSDRRREAMRKKIERFPGRLARAIAHISPEATHPPFDLKTHAGLVCPQIRITIQELACQGVANERILPVILAVARGLSVPIIGSFSARTVSRVMGEALVQARMQIGDELNKVRCKYSV